MLAFVVLNVADALFTAAFLWAGVVQEANPLLRAAWEASPAAFFGAKGALAGTAALWLARHRGWPAAGVALHGGLVLYSAVVGYHCALLGIFVLAGRP